MTDVRTPQVLAFESIPSVGECAAGLHSLRIVFRVADGRAIEKFDESTVKKELVRLSQTFDSMAVKVTGKGNDKHSYESKYRATNKKKATTAPLKLDAVESAADFISSVGGVTAAMQALAAAEQLAKKLG